MTFDFWNLTFGPFFSKCTILRLWHLFFDLVLIQSTQFFSGSTIHKIHVFNEAFFLLTSTMPMVTNIFKCHEELPSINLHDISMSGLVMSRDKWNVCLHLQKTYGHQTLPSLVLTYCEKLPHLALRTLWSSDQQVVTWQFKKFLFLLSQGFWPLKLAGCWLQGGGSARKCLSCHRLLVVFNFHAWWLSYPEYITAHYFLHHFGQFNYLTIHTEFN